MKRQADSAPPMRRPDGRTGHARVLARETYVTDSAEATAKLGEVLGELLQAGDLVLLKGPYGAGKTTFTQGVARGLGVADYVTSPSFTLVNEYRPAELDRHPPLFHLDLYRISGAVEALDFGLEEYLDERGVCVVEWPEKAAEALPREHLDVVFEIPNPAASDERRITFSAFGSRYRDLLARLLSRQPPEQVE